jgi:dTMP kinase
MSKGKYIVLEGPEGVGKTTQVQELARRLQAAGLPVRVLREPDSQSDLTARAIRQMTQDPRYPMNTRTEVLLYNAARAQSLEVIRNSVEQGVICIVDRNYLTTLAIQYYGRGDVPDYQTINSIISFAVGDMEPDLTIILDAPVQMLKERVKDRFSAERFDNLDDAFLERVRAGYLWEAKQRNLPVIFATDDTETVSNNIWHLASEVLSVRATAKPIPPSSLHRPSTTVSASDHDSAPPVEAPAQATEIDQKLTSIKEVLEQKAVPKPHAGPGSAGPNGSPQDELPADKSELVSKNSRGEYRVTGLGAAYLTDAVTDPTGSVYGFSEKLSPVTIAAAMARLSRRGDDMRITILDEFAEKVGKDEKLLHRVITAYGDDSVQQLVGVHMVVENASNLLTKKLEWGRLASYLEQSTRYIYFDQKDAEGKYKYYVPTNLDQKSAGIYCQAIDHIFDLYSEMVHKLTVYVREHSKVPQAERDGAFNGATRAQACDAIRAVLPTATKSTVGIFASGQALESLITHLLSDELPEAVETGKKLLKEGRKILPSFLERADKPDRGGATIAYRANTYRAVKNYALEHLPETHAANTAQAVNLVDVWPRNELSLVADMMYEHSGLPLQEIQAAVEKWPYAQKVDAFHTYIGERLNRRHRPGRAVEKAHYSFDIMCDYGIFRDLQRHRMVDDLEWQALTPRYGYEVPELVEQAGLSELFQECFDTSLTLYSQLQAAGYTLEAQYATLLGHQMRWKVTYNAREAFHLHELRTSPQGHPGYRKLVKEMHEKVAEVHPLMASAMRFVNKGEDEELTRLAAERYTQFKLRQI